MLLDGRNLPERAGPYTGSLDEQRPCNTTQHPEHDEYDHLEELPVRQVADFEQDDLARTIWVEGFQGQSGSDAAEEGPEKRLWREVIAHFLQAE